MVLYYLRWSTPLLLNLIDCLVCRRDRGGAGLEGGAATEGSGGAQGDQPQSAGSAEGRGQATQPGHAGCGGSQAGSRQVQMAFLEQAKWDLSHRKGRSRKMYLFCVKNFFSIQAV